MYTQENNDIIIWEESKDLLSKLASVDKKNSRYFHYTNIEGVLGIFEKYIKNQTIYFTRPEHNYPEECTMFASNIRFLNDNAEYREGELYLAKKNKEINNIIINESIYSISFCGKCDTLSQWKWYGKNSGIAIEFDLDNIKYKWYNRIDEKDEEKGYDNRINAIAVKYSEKDKEKFLYNIIKEIIPERKDGTNRRAKINKVIKNIEDFKNLQNIKKVFIPFCKNYGFYEEEESRIIFYTYDRSSENTVDLRGNSHDAPIYTFDINYKLNSNGVAKPTLNVKLKHKYQKSVVKSFTVGPGQNQQLIFNALIHIFDREKYHFYEDLRDIKSQCYDGDYNYFLADEDGKPKNSDKRYWTHICKNGIIIRKSSVPFRG